MRCATWRAFSPGRALLGQPARRCPGGDLPRADFDGFLIHLSARYPDMPAPLLRRLARAYGADAERLLGQARTPDDLGEDFGAGLSAREIDFLATREWARTAEDILFRRSKLGLHTPPDAAAAIDAYLGTKSDWRGG